MPEKPWQPYAPNGQRIEGQLSLKDARLGALHGAVHVWLWQLDGNGEKKVLLQRRSAAVTTWPNCWDISAAGHIDAGEATLDAALRETQEEVGLSVDKSALSLLFAFRQRIVYDTIIENELQWIYGLQLTEEHIFLLQADEVSETMWLPLSDLRRLANGELEGHDLVPHGDVYFQNVVRGLELSD